MPEIEFEIDNKNQLALFKKLIEQEVPAAQLSLILRNVYFEYTQMAVRNYRTAGYLANDLEDQLFFLVELIKVCEGDIPESEAIAVTPIPNQD